MIDMIRQYEHTDKVAYATEIEREMAALSHGTVSFEPTEREKTSLPYRPTLWVVDNIKRGDTLSFAGGRPGNIDSIRPGGGLHIRYADFVDGQVAARDLKAGEPLQWDMIDFVKSSLAKIA